MKKEFEVIDEIQPLRLKIYELDGKKHITSFFNEQRHTMCGLNVEESVASKAKKITCDVCKIHIGNLLKGTYR